MGKLVFATVGTTQFNLFIQTICEQKFLQLLKQLGYSQLVIQIGNGTFVPPESGVEGLTIDFFRFKKSIEADILRADLIISHAGAGTCLEVLRAGKLLLVVVNEQLMNNHQLELAQHYHEEGYLLYSTCNTLFDNLTKTKTNSLKRYPKGKADIFAEYLDRTMGFSA